MVNRACCTSQDSHLLLPDYQQPRLHRSKSCDAAQHPAAGFVAAAAYLSNPQQFTSRVV
jgi:hypothetical protein